MPKRDRIFGMIIVIFMLSTTLFLSGCITSEEPLQNLSAPNNNDSPIGQKSEAERGIDNNINASDIVEGAITGQSFNESAGVLTKEWNSSNFPGFWRDQEKNVSTENLIIDQSLLNNSYRVIDKHNLIYTTKPITLNYEVYEYANRTPAGTKWLLFGAWVGRGKICAFTGEKDCRDNPGAEGI